MKILSLLFFTQKVFGEEREEEKEDKKKGQKCMEKKSQTRPTSV